MKKEMRHTIPEIRHARFRTINRKDKLIKELYPNAPYCRHKGSLSHGKIHCSCPMCAAKTNSRKLTGHHKNWKISDLKKIDNMNDKLEEYFRKLD